MNDKTVSLKDYFDKRLEDLVLRIEQARIYMDKRLDGMNEFRAALENQSNNSPSRSEMKLEIQGLRSEMCVITDSIRAELKELSAFKNNQGGIASARDVNTANTRANLSIGITIILGIFTVVMTLLK